MYNNNKRPTESFVVAKVGQTTIPSSGTLNNTTTGNVNLADGQLGFVSDSIFGTVAMNAFTDATPTVAEAPVIAIYQGNGNSASINTATATYPLSVQPYERTNAIDGRGDVRVTKQTFRLPAHNVWVVGNATTEADAVNVTDEALYEIAIGLRGRRVEEAYSLEQAAYYRAKYQAPNFTDLGLSDALATDQILTYLSWEINRNSKALAVNSRFPSKLPVLSLLVSTAGGTGTAIGGVDPIVAGDVISVVNTAGGLRNITLTEAMAESIKNAAIAATGDVIADVTWTILTTDLANAGSATGGTADVLLIVGLDEDLAYVDYVPQVKVALEVTLPQGFNYNTVRYLDAVKADEGQGLARQLDLYWKATQGQRKYNTRHTQDPVINYPSPIVDGQKYVVYNIMHNSYMSVDSFNTVHQPLKEIVCIPAYSSGTTPNPLISTFDTVLNTWLASSTHNTSIITLN